MKYCPEQLNSTTHPFPEILYPELHFEHAPVVLFMVAQFAPLLEFVQELAEPVEYVPEAQAYFAPF